MIISSGYIFAKTIAEEEALPDDVIFDNGRFNPKCMLAGRDFDFNEYLLNPKGNTTSSAEKNALIDNTSSPVVDITTGKTIYTNDDGAGIFSIENKILTLHKGDGKNTSVFIFLNPYIAHAGKKLCFRWRLGADSSGGGFSAYAYKVVNKGYSSGVYINGLSSIGGNGDGYGRVDDSWRDVKITIQGTLKSMYCFELPLNNSLSYEISKIWLEDNADIDNVLMQYNTLNPRLVMGGVWYNEDAYTTPPVSSYRDQVNYVLNYTNHYVSDFLDTKDDQNFASNIICTGGIYCKPWRIYAVGASVTNAYVGSAFVPLSDAVSKYRTVYVSVRAASIFDASVGAPFYVRLYRITGSGIYYGPSNEVIIQDSQTHIVAVGVEETVPNFIRLEGGYGCDYIIDKIWFE